MGRRSALTLLAAVAVAALVASVALGTVGMGRAIDQTVGLNWYLNPNARLMANYVLTNYDRVQAAGAAPVTGQTLNTLEMRGQFEF